MTLHFRILAVLGATAIAGCEQDSRVAPLETRVAALETEVQALKQQASIDKMMKGFEGVAYLTPGAEGYSVIKGDLGALTVRLANVEPYASGSKITLQFGNLSSATIDGLKAKVDWGTVDKNGVANNADAKSREVVFEDPLLTGAWINSTIVLEGIPPTSLGFVRLSDLGHRGVRLRKVAGA